MTSRPVPITPEAAVTRFPGAMESLRDPVDPDDGDVLFTFEWGLHLGSPLDRLCDTWDPGRAAWVESGARVVALVTQMYGG
jgi:hypothetical protein